MTRMTPMFLKTYGYILDGHLTVDYILLKVFSIYTVFNQAYSLYTSFLYKYTYSCV